MLWPTCSRFSVFSLQGETFLLGRGGYGYTETIRAYAYACVVSEKQTTRKGTGNCLLETVDQTYPM